MVSRIEPSREEAPDQGALPRRERGSSLVVDETAEMSREEADTGSGCAVVRLSSAVTPSGASAAQSR
jgi:hypothetical protein